PITYAHVTLTPGAQLRLLWSPAYSAFAYVLSGRGSVGAEGRPLEDGQLAVFGPGDHLVVTADHAGPLEVLLLGGLPIGAPVYHYGPFVMNTRDEIIQTLQDYQAARLGIVPADQLAPRDFA
ncbi:MAG: pirin-like C-terminal cupin domain-containing protein, partial [Candidatus Limnocylindrales bacterium]